jgi:hypothetical protein
MVGYGGGLRLWRVWSLVVYFVLMRLEVAVKAFLHSIYFEKKFRTFCTFSTIRKDNVCSKLYYCLTLGRLIPVKSDWN